MWGQRAAWSCISRCYWITISCSIWPLVPSLRWSSKLMSGWSGSLRCQGTQELPCLPNWRADSKWKLLSLRVNNSHQPYSRKGGPHLNDHRTRASTMMSSGGNRPRRALKMSGWALGSNIPSSNSSDRKRATIGASGSRKKRGLSQW